MVEKQVEKLKKQVENTSIESLSFCEKDILQKLTKDYRTIKEIARQRQTSDKAVYKIVKKLKEKGYLSKVEKNFYKRGVTIDNSTQDDTKIRLHAIAFNIKIISSSPIYERELKLSNQTKEDSNTLMLYNDNITIYFNKSFIGENVDECVKRSLLYIEKLLILIENRFKIILIKAKYNNIKFFRSEVAKTNDPLAKRVLELKENSFKVYDDLGRLRLIIDNSFNLSELELVSQEYAGDTRKVQAMYKDLLQKESLLPSELTKHISGLQIADNITSSRISKNEELMTDLIKMIGQQQLLINSLREEIENVKTPSWSKF